MRGGLERSGFDWDFEPFGAGGVLVAVAVGVFGYLHVDAEIGGVEVEHNSLFFKPESLMGLRDNIVDVLVNGLF